MTEAPPPAPPPDLPEAAVRHRGRLSLIWLIPIVAAVIAIWLGVQSLSSRGPLVTLSFENGNGITAGQTQVKHKAVALGTVEDISLSPDKKRVVVHVRMTREAEPLLTSEARFWVVRPRLALGSISGLETLVSGAYIELDPGLIQGQPKTDFMALSEPPAVRSDDPGRSFQLRADRIGSLGPGSPVFFRDVAVGEVLGYDLGNGEGPATVSIFVHSPYDKFVHKDSRFWNTSGLTVSLGAQGVRLEFESIQAILAGGVAFATPHEARDTPPAERTDVFKLFDTQTDAAAAGFRERIKVITYLQTSVRGIAPGSRVEMFGIQVGQVTGVKLLLDNGDAVPRVQVRMEIQPERVMQSQDTARDHPPKEVLQNFVAKGMRATLQTSSFITGQEVVSFEFVPNAKPAQVTQEDDAFVVPGQGGGLDGITSGLSDIVAKLDGLPLAQIGENLNNLIGSLNETLGGPDTKQAIRSLSATMADVRDLVQKADAGLAPALKRLPDISAELQTTIGNANKVLGSVGAGYGQNSDFERNLERLLAQVNDAARSIRLLADFLDRHPEALIRGRPGEPAN